MASRQVYSREFEERVFFHYKNGVTCKPMLDKLIPEFPEYDLTYDRLAAYIEHRQHALTEARDAHQAFLAEVRSSEAAETAKRVLALEQSILVSLEGEADRCRTALAQFQPWDKQHAQITTTLTRILKEIEKFSKTGTLRKVEEAKAVTKAKEDAKGQQPTDPFKQAKLATGNIV